MNRGQGQALPLQVFITSKILYEVLISLVVLMSVCFMLTTTTHARAQRRSAPKQTATQARPKIKPTAKAAPTKPTATASAPRASGKNITIRTGPKASIWLDELRRGATDASGQFVINNVRAGRHALRVRATGFREHTLQVLPAQRGTIEVKLVPTTDEAELAFQRAEDAREGVAGADGVRGDAEELYRRALEMRPDFPAAHVGLSRVLLSKEDFDGALAEIEEARRVRPAYAEASAVEGRILRSAANSNAAIESYQRAIREGHGFQPEAYTGLGIVLGEKGRHEESVAAFLKAIAQLQDTEPALYQLVGAAYEKSEKYKEAVAAYEKYLVLAPEGKLAPAIRSILDQLRQQAAQQE